MSTVVTVVAKVIAGLAALVPLALTWKTMEEYLNDAQRELVRSPAISLAFAFGSVYAATGDILASLVTLSTAAAIFAVVGGELERGIKEILNRHKRM